jgi:hypothetical protein
MIGSELIFSCPKCKTKISSGHCEWDYMTPAQRFTVFSKLVWWFISSFWFGATIGGGAYLFFIKIVKSSHETSLKYSIIVWLLSSIALGVQQCKGVWQEIKESKARTGNSDSETQPMG